MIYKYTLDVTQPVNRVQMPKGAKILHVASVNDQVCVWARVIPTAPLVDRSLSMVDTGEPLLADHKTSRYIGTAVLVSGQLVVHVFDLGEV